MPKDPTRNVDRYKIRGGTLNTFDFDRNRTEMSEGQQVREEGTLIPHSDEPERIAKLLAKYGEAQPKPEPPRKRAARKATAKKASKKASKKAPVTLPAAKRKAPSKKTKPEPPRKRAARKATAKKASKKAPAALPAAKRKAPSKKK